MTEHTPIPVAGYTTQSDAKVALVNEFKQDEERLLRKIDAMEAENMRVFNATDKAVDFPYDDTLMYEAERYFRMGFMLLNRAVFQPQRISLPEDAPLAAQGVAVGEDTQG